MELWDVFISHASEDKKSFVDPLAQRLQELEVRVWYDRFVLLPGDRITEKIAEGLANCRFGLLVISNAFIKKQWTKFELSGLVGRNVEDGTRLIPVLLGVTRKALAAFNPTLATLLYIKGDPKNIDDCARQILRVVRPQLYDNIALLSAHGIKNVTVRTVAASEIKPGPIRHHDLPPALLVRIQNVWFATRENIETSLDETIENFQRDLRPELQVEVFERIIGATSIAMDILKTDDIGVKNDLLRIILKFSFGAQDKVMADVNAGKSREAVVEAAATAWLNVIPKVTVGDVEEDGLPKKNASKKKSPRR